MRYSTHGLVRVQNGLGPRLTLIASTPDDLSPSGQMLPGLGALIANTWSPGHLVEGELFHELDPGIGRCLEFLDTLLSVTLVV